MKFFAKAFFDFLNEKGVKNFSYSDIEDFNNYLLENDSEVFSAVQKRKKDQEEIDSLKINCQSNKDYYFQICNLLSNDKNNALYQIEKFKLDNTFSRATTFFYKEIERMCTEEYKNLVGFIGDFILTDDIMRLGRTLLDFHLSLKNYSFAENLAKTLVVLNQRDKYHATIDLAHIYLRNNDLEKITRLYAKCTSPSVEVIFCLFICYLLNNKDNYAISLVPEIKNKNCYLIPYFMGMIDSKICENYHKNDEQLSKCIEIIKDLQDYFPKEKQELLLSQLSEDTCSDIIAESFLGDIEKMIVIKEIYRSNNQIIKRGELFNIVVDYFFSKTHNALESGEKVNKIIDSLEKENYIFIDQGNISLTLLGQAYLNLKSKTLI